MNPPLDTLGANILVVDDQPANLLLLGRLLAEAGYRRVTSTADPTTVRALHRLHEYDLILLDLQMPVMDGFAVMQGLRTDTAETYLPVIVLTAQAGHKLQALQAGAKDFLSKPFDLAEVRTRIHNMLEVRLLYRALRAHSRSLEDLVAERTAELRESEARYRRLTELASDWFWEQDADGRFTRASGPVLALLGEPAGPPADSGWHAGELAALRACIDARRPFIDLPLHHTAPDGQQTWCRVSGEPVFDAACRYQGYRGVGVDTTHRH